MCIRDSLAGRGGVDRDAIFSESVVLKDAEYAGCMVRKDRWKYAYYLDGSSELYDLEDDRGETENLSGRMDLKDVEDELRERVVRFWEPSQQTGRYAATPRMAREKHFYEFSNQFLLGDGTVVDGRP